MQENHSLVTLEDRKKLSVTNVESVNGFSEKTIQLTVCGSRMTIEGESLKILSFSQGGGSFTASGEVNQIKFGGGKKISKLFK